MSLLRSLIHGWVRLRDATRREFLRDPDVVLFERTTTGQEGIGGR
ncbi:MAG TPA: hypothetical protein VJM09_02975 [Sphingobium sp.]|nr:hypothetical protein [Sphingobium sp.]